MIQIGSVVRSIAGHDQNRFYVVLSLEERFAYIADGKLRRLAKPKRKNLIHLRATNTLLDLEQLTSDKQLRTLLKPFNETNVTTTGGERVVERRCNRD